MATEVIPGPLGPVRAASTAAGGTALSTTAAFIQLPLGTRTVMMLPRNFVTAVVLQYGTPPWLTILKTADSLVTAPTVASNNMQDAATGTTLSLNSFDVAANGNFVYAGSHRMFRGARAIVSDVNPTASALTVKYWNGAWADASASDGTRTGGNTTLGQSGNVTWTVPTDWVAVSLKDAGDTSGTFAGCTEKLYWTRWEVSVQLGTPVTLTGLVALERTTNYAEWPSGTPLEFPVHMGPGGIGCIEALVNAGTGNLIVNVAASQASDFV